MTTTTVLKGQSYTTGAIHYAREVRHIDRTVRQLMLAPLCGMRRNAIAYLATVSADTEVTCKRCIASVGNGGAK